MITHEEEDACEESMQPRAEVPRRIVRDSRDELIEALHEQIKLMAQEIRDLQVNRSPAREEKEHVQEDMPRERVHGRPKSELHREEPQMKKEGGQWSPQRGTLESHGSWEAHQANKEHCDEIGRAHV